MSATTEPTITQLTPPAEAAALSAESDQPKMIEQTCRVGVTAHNVTADMLRDGLVLPMMCRGLKEGTNKGIISSLELVSAYTDIDAPLQVSANLFENAEGERVGYQSIGIANAVGWPLFDAGRQEFSPLVKMHPCEAQRYTTPIKLFQPGSEQLSDRFIHQYGEETASSLRASVVDLPGEPYSLVDKSSTIARIIDANWEVLGLNVPSQPSALDGRWIRCADSVVSHVVSELQETVLDHIPFSSMEGLEAHLQVGDEAIDMLDDDAHYGLDVEMKVTLRTPQPQQD